MPEKQISVEESIEKGYYPAAIFQLKSNLELNVIVEEEKDKITDKILSCIDLYSENSFDINKVIGELDSIIYDEDFFNSLSNLSKSKYLIKMWEQYFNIWKIKTSLEYYEKALELWNQDILKTIIYIKTIFLFKENKNKDFAVAESVNLLGRLDNPELNISDRKLIKNDMEQFIFGFNLPIEKPESEKEEIYNLEIEAEECRKERLRYFLNSKIQNYEENWGDLKKDYLKVNDNLKNLYGKYNSSVRKYWIKSISANSYVNSVNMIGWKDSKFENYSSYSSDFVQTSFDMVESYNSSWNIGGAIEILIVICDNWLKNLDDNNQQYILDLLYKLSSQDLEAEYKYTISDLIKENINKMNRTYRAMMMSWDIFINVWEYLRALSVYTVYIKDEVILTEKIKDILESIFNNTDNVNPELLVILDKIILWEKLDLRKSAYGSNWEFKTTDFNILVRYIK